MPISAKNDVPGERSRSNGELAAIVLGLALGLLLGCAVFLRGSAAGSRSANGGGAAGLSPSAASSRLSAGAEEMNGADSSLRGIEPASRRAEAARAELLADELSALPDAPRDAAAPASDATSPRTTTGATIDGVAPAAAESGTAAAARSAAMPENRSSARNGHPVSGEATLAYWNRLNEVIAREAALRAAPAELTSANVGGFVDARIQAARFASSAIGELEGAAVDPDALALGKELVAWYRDEIANNERAKSLLGSSDSAARKGSAGKSWRASEERHSRQCDEINRHGRDLRARLSRKYGLVFPPLN
jgi:hypothetical protein